MAEREIKIKLVAIPVIPKEMNVGDTLTFSSPHGKFRVVIEHGSPFADPAVIEINDGRELALKKEGTFFCKCFVKPPGMSEIGWSKNDPESGGFCGVGPGRPPL
ncbi:MAG TPA: hypothetical protein VHA33_06220 [Candidatus Angelobacter sp.]|jgi:hypothetical protein|nr:hypothetical protein [Candidatus Angelobacter sp.]